MIKKLIVLLLACNCSIIYAQTIKTDVLVIGNGASAVASAVQSAHSKLKTVLAATEISIGDDSTASNKMVEVDANSSLPYGTWGEFRELIKDHYKGTAGYDTTSASLKFEPQVGTEILKSMTDTVKNLTVYLQAPFTAIKKTAIDGR